MKCKSGVEIHKGDKVLFHGEPAEIEFIVESSVGDPAMDWYVNEQGPGVMVLEPKVFGRAYIRDTENVEELVLVSRSESPPTPG